MQGSISLSGLYTGLVQGSTPPCGKPRSLGVAGFRFAALGLRAWGSGVAGL